MKKLVGLILMVCSMELFAQSFSFPYSKIPFGKSMEEVLAMCEGAEITEDKDSKVDFIGNYSLSLLQGGIYTHWGMGAYLASDISKTYEIRDPKWENIQSIKLYFVADFEKTNYTLMMVAKYQKTDSWDRDVVYKTMRDNISSSLKNTRYSEFAERYKNMGFGYVNAVGARWNSNSNTIYLFVDDLGFMSNSSLKGPLIIYSNDSQASKYMKAVKLYEDDRQKKKEASVKTEF